VDTPADLPDLPTVRHRPTPLTVDCSRYPEVLTGKKRDKPVKVFDLAFFGFELDVLEARMYELQESVDLFVINEATRLHRGMRKPLFFAQNQRRFAPFLNRTMYLLTDDSATWKDKLDDDTPDGVPGKNEIPQKWNIESHQRSILWKKFVEAYGNDNINDDDLFIHGDLDEVPDGDVIYQMKHCETKLPAGLKKKKKKIFFFVNLFPLGFCPRQYTIHFRFPSSKHLAEVCYKPGVMNRKHILNNKGKVPYHYKVENKVLAGMHAHTGSLALHLYKYLAAPEGGISREKPLDFLQNPLGIPLNQVKHGRRVCCMQDGKQTAVEDEGQMSKFWKPWVMLANKERYPEFFSQNIYYSKEEEGPKLSQD
jgi:hypothetical protein